MNRVLSPPAAGDEHDRFDSVSRRTRVGWGRVFGEVSAVIILIVLCAYAVGLLDAGRMAAGMVDIVDLLTQSWPPDFTDLDSWWHPLWDSLSMSVAATALAILLSVPIALLGARNTSPHPAVYWAARMMLNTLRSVPELIIAIVFVAAVGFGALPGALALGIHSAGMVGKFFAEAIEHADQAPIEAARAVGATPPQVILHGVLSQVLPQMADVTIYRWEYNFRASVVVGVVGAGGIGFELIAALRTLQYHKVAAILLLILATVTVVDGFGGFLRRRFA
ncbi:phosphate ABC transporter permease [Mycobacteroides sp. H001]|uniref:Phosphonate ABC transporter, permease protein PhnE n=1 Tax=Mycolicibacterium rhodesiae TaxID=36814 RepID=A0A1X0II23_MYCRH|nr:MULTISPECIES: phosphonate ABC transporter, permease protein PhnE [Mycobacteriaceae]KRQ18102.1 phosphate ABC transporter permease [Mycobacteroides sp. H072]KRQ68195.1 phosphate ABC transporter permease [Mycobacteroides sp. H001]MCV7343311.1 phosphonate ABC transporter, permease protein PhnE [Mycolicibacterium rhodesiae]ORB47049.1 phosphonate ABC transporter, permease protein PhnE [Mycolicibacterium rhodesiae]WGI36235.1 phosphonate ABC transporter, permease protein PhnE [Mycolicibacterium aub